jgi:hypothetical protein
MRTLLRLRIGRQRNGQDVEDAFCRSPAEQGAMAPKGQSLLDGLARAGR